MTLRSKKRIGLVDDDEMVRFATKVLLSSYNFDVAEFDSAESLLRTDSIANLDCLLVDYRMDGMNGLELLNELRHRKITIPIVVVSGYTSGTEVSELKLAGAAAVMDKPVRTDALLENLRNLTGQVEVQSN